MEIDRKELIASLGGEAAVKSMDHEARADALEDFLSSAARCRGCGAAGQRNPIRRSPITRAGSTSAATGAG